MASTQKLQPPGAGLPGWERVMLSGMLKLGCLLKSDRSALESFRRESEILLSIFDQADLNDVCEPVLIGRLTGIEDSSRNWSLLMVLQHLSMVNRDMLKIIDALNRGIVPRGTVAIDYYKPESDLDLDAADNFKEATYDFLEVVGALEKLDRRLTYSHPWFGNMNSHQWNVLAAAHMKIHRKQAQAIVAKLGVI
jgi:uncharacterized damage-inducible protein DinB